VRPAAFLARTSSTVLVAWLSLASPLAAQTGTVTKISNAAIVDVSRVRIDNFGQVDSAYYRGAQPAGQDYADLAALGIRTVIDLQADGDNSTEAGLVERAGMKFLRIPMTTHVAPTAEQLALFLQIVNDPTQQPVYVHCAGGRHRTGVMTAVYRMENHGWTADQAFKEMKRYKFGLDFLHSEFKNFVYGYQPVAAKGPVLAVATPKIQG
jgi:protein tyrosine/serine phosphatase